MRLFTVVAVSCLSSVLQSAFCHGEGLRLLPLRFFGGGAVVKELRASSRNSEVLNRKRWFPDSDVNKHKKRSPGIGSCNAEDWWVLSLPKVYLSYVTFIIVAHLVVIAVEDFTTASLFLHFLYLDLFA
jgi:hypothetical protein